jgi:small subunit ribosomal protein S2
MALPDFTMRQLLEAGAHFGHQTHRWNPKMERYIFGARANIHIIDLSQTMPLLHQALVKVREVAASGGRVLFVGTKRQASEPVAAGAKRCAQYYVNHRWLGGTLTNWRTISGSIARLRELEGVLDGGDAGGRTKKELLKLTREREKLELSLGGIKDMGGIPDLMFVIDTNKEAIAVLEARKLNIPVVAILDTNSDPIGISFPVPGNDDAARALQLYCDLVADAVLDGLTEGQVAMGVDIGASEEPVEPALRMSAAQEAAPEPEPAAAPEPELEAAFTGAAEAAAEPEPTLAAAEPEPEAAEPEPTVAAAEPEPTVAPAEPEPTAEPEPMVAPAEPEPQPEPAVAASEPEPEEPVAAEPEPTAEPEAPVAVAEPGPPVVAEAEAPPEPKPASKAKAASAAARKAKAAPPVEAASVKDAAPELAPAEEVAES